MAEIPTPPRPTPPEHFALPRYEPGNEPRGAHGSSVRPPNDRSEGTAVGALVCALIPSVITNLVGIGLAISVLNKPYGGRFNGRGKAIAALVIAPIWIVVTIALIVIADEVEADRDPTDGAVIEEGRLSPTDLQVGDCLSDPVELGVATTSVDVVPCDTPHRGEVFHVFEIPEGPWPGVDEVARFSAGGCAAAFETFIGITIDLTTLDGASFQPVEETWAEDRRVQCIVTTAEPRPGTLEGSGL